MPLQADTQRELRRTGFRQRASAGRLLLIGAVLLVAGVVLVAATGGFGNFVGFALGALSAPFLLGGVALMLSGLVARRSADRRPFA
ncbi:MAG TPA: hypothetical protein VN213_00370 [Solirubrobacteraceae bacterium]|nr:hypothetical protein [Solirubrobacteraceae bacterium]